jgi:hypothetical protein
MAWKIDHILLRVDAGIYVLDIGYVDEARRARLPALAPTYDWSG